MDDVLNQIVSASREAGKIAQHYRKAHSIGATTKASKSSGGLNSEGSAFLHTEVVTVADPEAEKFLREVLPSIVPVPVYGEEMGGEILDDCWVIDPIDGTTNYSLGVQAGGYGFYTDWGPLTSLRRGGEVVAAVIHRPCNGDFFLASKGNGAFVIDPAGEKTQLVLPEKISGNRVTVGYGLTLELKALTPEHVNLHQRFREIMQNRVRSLTVRMLGATGIESMAVACGVQTAYVSPGRYYDVAASELIIREAGGDVTLLAENGLNGTILMIASHKQIHKELVAAVKEVFITSPGLVVVGANAKSNARQEGK